GDRAAVLMANHGLLTVGKSPKDALKIANLVEITAEMVWGARSLGPLVPLPDSTKEKMAPIYKMLRGMERACLCAPWPVRASGGTNGFLAFAGEGESVGEGEHDDVDAVVGGDVVVEGLDRGGVLVGGLRVDHGAAPEHVVDADHAVRAHPRHE